MKTAALLTKRDSKYFKVIIKGDNSTLRKLRVQIGVRRIGLSAFYLPFTEDAIDFLENNNFEFNGAYKRYKQLKYEKDNPITKIPKYKKKDLKLYDYQMEGVNYIERHGGRALIADVMGLGKTIQALAWIQYNRDIENVLIVCPSSLKINWSEEFSKWVTRKFDIQILEGTTPYEITGNAVIVNYDILHSWLVDLKLTNFDVCIADELHYLKSEKALRTKAFKEIVMGIPSIVGLTGTPIENDPMEIYYLVNLINKNIFPNYMKFMLRYCDAQQVSVRVRGGTSRKVWKRKGFTNQKELHNILKKHVMIRRTFDDVDLQLPPKIYSNIHLKIDNEKEYYKAENEFIQYIKEKFDMQAEEELLEELGRYIDVEDVGLPVTQQAQLAKVNKLDAIARAPALAKLSELKILASKGKLKQIITWIEDFLETDEKLIVFAVNKVIIKALMDAFPDAVKIDGSTTAAKRDKAVKSFQNDADTRLFIGNIKAAGVGLTLTAASHIAIIQFPWNPGEVLQAEGRPHRIGQKAERVMVYKFIAKGTIDERLIKLLQFKQDEIDQIIDGKDVLKKQDVVKLLIDSYK